jgi:hypothetical protein
MRIYLNELQTDLHAVIPIRIREKLISKFVKEFLKAVGDTCRKELNWSIPDWTLRLGIGLPFSQTMERHNAL